MSQRLVVIGAGGMLGEMVQACAPAEWDIVPLQRSDLDLECPARIETVLADLSPRGIVNCAAFTDVDRCESEPDKAMQVNGVVPGHLARVAGTLGAVLVHISTDYVFSGERRVAYTEEHAVAPRSVYGRSKLAGEQAILDSGLEAFYIVRTSWLCGPGHDNFVETVLRLARERDELGIVADQVGAPSFTSDLSRAIFALLRGAAAAPVSPAPYGVYHFSNAGHCSRYEFACAILALAEQKRMLAGGTLIRPITTADYPLPAARPAWSVLALDKIRKATGIEIPHWRQALAVYFQTRADWSCA